MDSNNEVNLEVSAEGLDEMIGSLENFRLDLKQTQMMYNNTSDISEFLMTVKRTNDYVLDEESDDNNYYIFQTANNCGLEIDLKNNSVLLWVNLSEDIAVSSFITKS